jgi:hypothetical protein
MAETVADLLIERLTEWGAYRIYGYPGYGINDVTTALRKRARTWQASTCRWYVPCARSHTTPLRRGVTARSAT